MPQFRSSRKYAGIFMNLCAMCIASWMILKGIANPLEEVAGRIAQKYRLICFDEFHVSDIADAMILYNLLDALFRNKVSFVLTSNYAPDTLYPDGLHRERLLPAIKLLKEKLDIIQVDGGVDYRSRTLQPADVYFIVSDPKTTQALEQAFYYFAKTAGEKTVLQIEGREVTALRCAPGVVWFDFATLCAGPRSQNDYLEIAQRFDTLILSDVPKMPRAMASEARRFTWLIDILYDHRKKFLMSAEVNPEVLYTEGVLAAEFQRTVSRLTEMRSANYINTAQLTPLLSAKLIN